MTAFEIHVGSTNGGSTIEWSRFSMIQTQSIADGRVILRGMAV